MRSNSDGPQDDHQRPADVDDATVEAVGKVSEALEWVERARGELYSFHQLIGRADLLLSEACDKLCGAGHDQLAAQLTAEMVGRNVLFGRWTFQIVEDFDANYWTQFRQHEEEVRQQLLDGKRHVFESEMKERRRTSGEPGHESRPTRESIS